MTLWGGTNMKLYRHNSNAGTRPQGPSVPLRWHGSNTRKVLPKPLTLRSCLFRKSEARLLIDFAPLVRTFFASFAALSSRTPRLKAFHSHSAEISIEVVRTATHFSANSVFFASFAAFSSRTPRLEAFDPHSAEISVEGCPSRDSLLRQ